MRRVAVATTMIALAWSSLFAQVTTSPQRPDTTRRRAAEHVPKRSRADTLRGSFTTPLAPS